MIYFDNAATTMPKSRKAYKAYKRAFFSCGNASRGGHPFAVHASECLYECRERLADFFGTTPERAVLTMNATHAINLAVKGLIRGGTVLVSDLEHNAVMRPLYALEAAGSIKIRVFHVSLSDDDQTLEAFRGALDGDVSACVVTHASNICGRVLPAERLAAAAKENGALFICDASQTAGVYGIDLSAYDAPDVICMPGHKALYGPQGTGALLVSPSFEGRFDTLIEGGAGSYSADPQMPRLLPERLEAGTMNAPAFAGLAAALDEARTQTKKEKQIFAYLLDGMRSIRGITLYGAPENENIPYCPIILFNVNGKESEAAADELAGHGVCVRAGLHCAPLAHRALGTPENGAVRISLSRYSTFYEAERFLTILARHVAG